MADMPVLTLEAATISSASIAIVMMDANGDNVKIDWAELERQAQGKDLFLMPIAKALLAARASAQCKSP